MNSIMIRITVQLAWHYGAPMWNVTGEDFPPMAPRYARLDTLLGLIQARAKNWERCYIVTLLEPDTPPRVLTFDGSAAQALLPMELPMAA